MEGDTLRSKLTSLLQRSRQAQRLYSSVERMQRNEYSEFSELQAGEWRSTNAELAKELAALLESPDKKRLTSEINLVYSRFFERMLSLESELNSGQREVISAAERGDYSKATTLSRSLVALKARVEATQAVVHELESLSCTIASSLAVSTQVGSVSAKSLSQSDKKSESTKATEMLPEEDALQSQGRIGRMGKVIPLRGR